MKIGNVRFNRFALVSLFAALIMAMLSACGDSAPQPQVAAPATGTFCGSSWSYASAKGNQQKIVDQLEVALNLMGPDCGVIHEALRNPQFDQAIKDLLAIPQKQRFAADSPWNLMLGRNPGIKLALETQSYGVYDGSKINWYPLTQEAGLLRIVGNVATAYQGSANGISNATLIETLAAQLEQTGGDLHASLEATANVLGVSQGDARTRIRSLTAQGGWAAMSGLVCTAGKMSAQNCYNMYHFNQLLGK